MITLGIRLASVCVLVGCFSACSSSDSTLGDKAEGNWTLSDAESFREFELYWLGQSYQGFAQSEIFRYEGTASNRVIFVYGDATLDESGSWSSPLYVSIGPHCTGARERIRRLFPEGEEVQIQGLDGFLVDGGSSALQYLYLWPGEVTVSIRTFEELSLEQAGLDLTAFDDTSANGREPLPTSASLSC